MRTFCVFDRHYGDFIESFDTLVEARTFVSDLISKITKEGKLYDLAIGRYIDDTSDYYNIVETYTNKDNG